MNASSHALTRWLRCTLGSIRKGHIKPGFAMSQSTTTEREGNAGVDAIGNRTLSADVAVVPAIADVQFLKVFNCISDTIT